eukprot:tig00000342_g24226.t1
MSALGDLLRYADEEEDEEEHEEAENNREQPGRQPAVQAPRPVSLVSYAHDDEDDTKPEESPAAHAAPTGDRKPGSSLPPKAPRALAEAAARGGAPSPVFQITAAAQRVAADRTQAEQPPAEPGGPIASSSAGPGASAVTPPGISPSLQQTTPGRPSGSPMPLPQGSPFHTLANIPPEPPGPVDERVRAKLEQFVQLRAQGRRLNDSLRANKNFRNPAILEKLVEYWGIDEIGSNYPRDKFDPHAFDMEEFYDALAVRQRKAMEAKERAQANRSAVEFAPGGLQTTLLTDAGLLRPRPAAGAEGKPAKRSKWDAQDPASVAPIVPGGIIQASLQQAAAAAAAVAAAQAAQAAPGYAQYAAEMRKQAGIR